MRKCKSFFFFLLLVFIVYYEAKVSRILCHSYENAVNWSQKAKRRRTEGTGRMSHLKLVRRKFKNGFREGTSAVSKKAATN